MLAACCCCAVQHRPPCSPWTQAGLAFPPSAFARPAGPARCAPVRVEKRDGRSRSSRFESCYLLLCLLSSTRCALFSDLMILARRPRASPSLPPHAVAAAALAPLCCYPPAGARLGLFLLGLGQSWGGRRGLRCFLLLPLLPLLLSGVERVATVTSPPPRAVETHRRQGCPGAGWPLINQQNRPIRGCLA